MLDTAAFLQVDGVTAGPGCIPESFYTAKNKIICICALIAAIWVIISARSLPLL